MLSAKAQTRLAKLLAVANRLHSQPRVRREGDAPKVYGGDVSCPHLVGLRGMKVARQQIVGNGQLVFAVGGEDILSLAPCAYAVALHEFSDALFAYFEAPG